MNSSTTQANRISVIDALRGFALIGILFVNIISIINAIFPEPASGEWYLYRFFNYTIEQRFFLIFSMLFGTGFYIFISRAEKRGDNATRLFIRRLLVLLVFGIVHFMFQPGEALSIYAVIGFALIPFYQRKPGTIFLACLLALLLGIFFVEYFNVLSMMLLGLFMGKIQFFSRLDHFENRIKIVMWIALFLTPIALYIQYISLPTSWYGAGAGIGGVVMATLYVCVFLRFYKSATGRKYLRPLEYYGRMALTNYLGQTAIIVIAMKLFDLQGNIGLFQTTLMSIGIIVVQIPLSMLWLTFFRMGPLEWIWRVATYGKYVNIRK
ncbi:DUF418 domain-containing protein [Paenibacillus sp. Marseille-Q4541]|uniref:DUF418 domain-containing protein n=1 Tax=Paenibacillus sp. Marseille-Q4541 TaxID=2831522 RepID=UPI001BAA1C08|nr:DUF418 domain-containing protein [Paenibacillus sp. Marseille-Q4541]